MAYEYYFVVQSNVDIEQALKDIHAIMGFDFPIERQIFLVHAGLFVWDCYPIGGPPYLPDARELGPRMRKQYKDDVGIDLNILIYFPEHADSLKEKEELPSLFLKTALEFLRKHPGDALYEIGKTDELLWFRKSGKFFVTDNRNSLSQELLSMFPEPCEITSMKPYY